MKYGVCLEEKHKQKAIAAAGLYDLLVIDAQNYTAQEVRTIQAGGKTKVISYLNVGAVENDRPYFSAAKSKGLLLGKYDNWDGEYWVRAQKAAWREIILGVARDIKNKGVDGYWVDNLDILYTVDEEYHWDSSQKSELYNSLVDILEALHGWGYVMINGGDVFVDRAIRHKQASVFDGVNQETVITSILDYDPPGKFGRQSKDEQEYYTDYLDQVRMAEKDICLLEYATDSAIISEAESFARAKGYTLCVSHNIELGGDLSVTAQKNGQPTVWDVAKAIARFDGSETAHADTVAALRKEGHKVSMSSAWCTEQCIAILHAAGVKDSMIGGYTDNADSFKRHAEKAGIWHSGMDGIKPFYPVIFGSGGKGNHTEISVGYNLNVSGNYNGGTARRKWKGRKVLGYIKIKYSPMPDMDELQVAVASSDVILGVYGTKEAREAQLSVFGAANAAKIQAEVNRVWGHDDQIIFNMAAATIAGFMGRGSYRKKRLGKWEPKVQAKINQIYALRGRTTEEAAKLVLSNAFGKGAVRTLLLGFCGYDAPTVQAAVNKAVEKAREGKELKRASKSEGDMAKTLTIIDVSEHQGKIDWDKAWKTGIFDGVIIRTGYGDNQKDQDDVYAIYNMDECERIGIPYMTYLYSYAGRTEQNQSEIEHEKRMTAGRKTLGHILDLEEWGLRKNGEAAARAWLKSFPDGIIYAGQSWWKDPLLGLNCKKWIPAYGTNSGKAESKYKPGYPMEGWQYTSRGSVPGIKGNVDVSQWYGIFGKAETKDKPEGSGIRVVYKKDVALMLFIHLCTHNAHGYTMDMDGRQGAGEEVVDILGHKYTIKGGDRDCSSAIISAFEAAGISCGGATYTGNMKKCMVASGNFKVEPMSYTAQGADVYLNEKNHTAMCISAIPDILGQFSINEKGTGYGGNVGDQLQKGEYDSTYGRGESHLRPYYDYPWDFILQCTNNEVAFVIGNDEAAGPSEEAVLAAKVILGDYNKGDARRAALGSKYTPVQTRVNKAYTPENREMLVRAMAECIDKF